MTEAYSDALAAIIPVVVEIIEQHCGSQLRDDPRRFDAVVQEAVRELGRLASQRVAEALAGEAVKAAKAEGWVIERSPTITFWTIFGQINVRSPYLTSKRGEGGVRPVNDALGIRASGRSVQLERAMCDFGIDDSFEGAARKLREHYGLAINRTTFLRTVEEHGAHVALESRFAALAARCARPVAGPGVPHLVEMDGSCVRTGSLAPREAGAVTPKRGLPARRRTTEWRDLRLALVRRLDDDKVTFVGGISDFDDVVDHLVAEAIAIGWTPSSFTLRLTDGGKGLREALDARFPRGQHVLDKPHLVHHLHETAVAMDENAERAKETVAGWAQLISAGNVDDIKELLQAHTGRGKERAATLVGYLTRFADAVNYDDLQRRGLPIGSGEIESAHKGEVQQRLKLPGTWWTVDGANRVLALRLLRTNGKWDEYWRAAA